MEESSQPENNPADAPSGIETSQLSLWPAGSAGSAAESSSEADSGAPNDPRNRVADPAWNVFDLLLFVLFIFAVGIVTVGLAAAVYRQLRPLFGWVATPQTALSRIPVLLAMQLAVEGLGVLFIYLTIRIKYQRDFWRAIGWVRPPRGLFNFALAGATMALSLNWLSNYFPPDTHLPVEQWFADTASAYAVAAVGILAAPIIEELVFRGFFYPVFERRWGMVPGVVLTGILFASIHGFQLAWSWREVSVIFVVGLVLSYIRGRTGSLVPSYVMHVAYNTSLFIALYLTSDGFRKLQG